MRGARRGGVERRLRVARGERAIPLQLVDERALEVRAGEREPVGTGAEGRNPLRERPVEPVPEGLGQRLDRRVLLGLGAVGLFFHGGVHPRQLLPIVVPHADPLRTERGLVDEPLPRGDGFGSVDLLQQRPHRPGVDGAGARQHELVERVAQLPRGLPPLLRVAREGARDGVPEGAGVGLVERRRARHGRLAHAAHGLDVAVLPEEPPVE